MYESKSLYLWFLLPCFFTVLKFREPRIDFVHPNNPTLENREFKVPKIHLLVVRALNEL